MSQSSTVQMRSHIVGFAVACLCAINGCGSGERTYHLSGSITFKGQPVPSGHIIFEPDSSKGNSGAPGRSKIVDGKYDTRSEDGMGIVGGPHMIRIMGLGGQSKGASQGEIALPNMLFPEFTVSEDLAKQDGTKDFTIPEKR